jgi:hypothetical protein
MQRKGKMRGFDVYKAVAVEKERCSDWTMEREMRDLGTEMHISKACIFYAQPEIGTCIPQPMIPFQNLIVTNRKSRQH